MAHFAVIDVETTGLYPNRHDRVVEIAALLVSDDGSVVREFTSIINPERDVGPTHIHGLSASDILQAPLFSEVAMPLLEVLRPSVAVVGHNVRFDVSFLKLEFSRLGVELPHCELLDTLLMSGGGTLAACCACHGIELEDKGHSAAHDALATARLFSALLRKSQSLNIDIASLRPVSWPLMLLPTKKPVRRDEARQQQSHAPSYIQDLVRRLPPFAGKSADQHAVMSYVDLLGRALEDRNIEAVEGKSLVDLASLYGLTFDQIKIIHGEYLRRLVKTACADGVVTTKEKQDLELVSRLLGFEEIDQEHLESLIQSVVNSNNQEGLALPDEDFLRGKCVCFTGEAQCKLNGVLISRELATSLAERHGLIVVNSVTKKLDMLIVSDPLTQSSKAKKARQYGLRIMHEIEFWRILGVAIE